MNKKLLLSLAIAGIVGTTQSFAAVEYWVSTNGNDSNDGSEAAPFASVEMAALSVKDNTETIIHLEKDATFHVGKIDFSENKLVTIIGDNTTLLGADKPGNEGGEANRIFRGNTNSSFVLKGLNFRNGRQVEYWGGGAIFFNGDRLEIENCNFYNNEAGSSGAAIASRGKVVSVKNCYFEGNYTIGGGARGAAIMQCGPNNGEAGELYVENSTFYQNKLTMGGQGTAIGIYDPSTGIQYTATNRVDVKNCTFVGNYSADPYQAAIDISDNTDCEAYIINNTFYDNDGALRIFYQMAPVYFINNFAYANKSCVLSECSIAEYDRAAVTAYNNILIGVERSVNENMDDPCFGAQASACSNTLGLANDKPIQSFGIATTLKSDDNCFVPYLPINSENSPLVDAGLDDSSEFTGDNAVPAYDVRGLATNGKRDIGAYEYPNPGSVNNIATDNGICFLQDATSIRVNGATSVSVFSIDGKLAASATGEAVAFSTNDLPKGIAIVKATSEKGSSTHKFIIR